MSTQKDESYTGSDEANTYESQDGNDTLTGLSGNDQLSGGRGNDYIEGGDGDDKLTGDSSDQLIALPDLITMQETRTVSIRFDTDGAQNQNSIGFYRVDPATNEILDVGMVWANASAIGDGGDLVQGVSTETIETEAGDQLGFFVVSDGFADSNLSNLQGAYLEFRNEDGDIATINDTSPDLVVVHEDGTTDIIENDVFHSSAFGDRAGLNPDGAEHTVGVVQANDGTIQLGFEETSGGDNDFNDVVITVDVGEATATALHEQYTEQGLEETENLDVQSTSLNFNPSDTADRLHGELGADTLEGNQGNDLLAGDGAGEEWELVDGEWVYDESKIQDTGEPQDTSNDVLIGASGNDVLNASFGDDRLSGGSGDDRLNAGSGNDFADGGYGADAINLEDGDDVGKGGLGADTIHAGAGDDIVYGDRGNIVDNGDYGAGPQSGNGLSFLGASGGWSGGEAEINNANQQIRSVEQSIDTVAGETYSMDFGLALGSLSAQGATSVEIYWNGDLVETIEPTTATYEQISVNLQGTGGKDALEIREIINLDQISNEQGIYTINTELVVNGETLEVDGFAPGQSNLYQVIGNQFYVFDTESGEYQAVGESFGFNVNAAGFNTNDNLIYGVANNKKPVVDSNGDTILNNDVIAIDASGQFYRIGHLDLDDKISNSINIGDFGSDGAMYVMSSSSRGNLFRVDLNNVSPDGIIAYEEIPLPGGLWGLGDWAWIENEQAFVTINKNGTIFKIDPHNLVDGVASVETSQITSLMVDGNTVEGPPNGAGWGAIFTDADGNLYAGLNHGDHDLDGSTEDSGGIYQITGFEGDTAQAVLLAATSATSSNDGISDPRSMSTFTMVDDDISVLIDNVRLTGTLGGDDQITGGLGDDQIYGEIGSDEIFGQEGNDTIDGGDGNDVLFGDTGDDSVVGGAGQDHIEGGDGNDSLSGNTGDDTVMGGSGSDMVDGGSGSDKLVGGSGSDTIISGAGDDHLWGGEWQADGEVDLFVFSPGTGQDMIHDFEADRDMIDLSAYGLTWDELQGGIHDHGWAVSIELGAIGGEEGDRIFLTNVSTAELSEDNFDFGG